MPTPKYQVGDVQWTTASEWGLRKSTVTACDACLGSGTLIARNKAKVSCSVCYGGGVITKYSPAPVPAEVLVVQVVVSSSFPGVWEYGYYFGEDGSFRQATIDPEYLFDTREAAVAAKGGK